MRSASRRFLVTGAGGFVGSRLVRRLVEAWPGAEVVAAGSREDATGQIRYVKADVRDPAFVDLIGSVQPTDILHLAAKSSVAGAEQARTEAMDVSVLGAVNLSDGVRRFAPNARILFASSGEVYGKAFASGDRLTEDSPTLPGNVYARGKLAAEIILTDRVGDDASLFVMRPLNHTGPGQDLRFVVPTFARQVAELEAGLAPPVIKVGNLDAARDFLGVDDVIEAYLGVIALDATPGATVLNVSADAVTPLQSILDDLLSLTTVSCSIEVDPSRWRPNPIPATRLSSDRLRNLIEWRPRQELKQVLKATLEYYRAELLASV